MFPLKKDQNHDIIIIRSIRNYSLVIATYIE